MQDGEEEVSQQSNANIFRTASPACSKKKKKIDNESPYLTA